MPFMTQLEPAALVRHFLAHPPRDFDAECLLGDIPAFSARFDILTTAEPALRKRVAQWPLYRLWHRWLGLRTRFIGSTVAEYAWLPGNEDPTELARRIRQTQSPLFALLVIKDIPHDSPLISAAANTWTDAFVESCVVQGFTMVEGQALAWVAIDHTSVDDYLSRLSRARRRDLRRKLRSRAELDVEILTTGPGLDDPEVIDALYALYADVFAQSEIHFDFLERAFFAALLTDADSGGVLFVYRQNGSLIGWNLCFEYAGKLVDKYMGLAYPQARNMNLYAVSWFENLEYARVRGLSHYVAGWTDPEVKAQLGARFTLTRHAVYPRNFLLRALLKRIAGFFESDRHWRQSREHHANADS